MLGNKCEKRKSSKNIYLKAFICIDKGFFLSNTEGVAYLGIFLTPSQSIFNTVQTMNVIKQVLCGFLCMAAVALTAQNRGGQWRTPFERDSNQTATYDEGMAFYQKLQPMWVARCTPLSCQRIKVLRQNWPKKEKNVSFLSIMAYIRASLRALMLP